MEDKEIKARYRKEKKNMIRKARRTKKEAPIIITIITVLVFLMTYCFDSSFYRYYRIPLSNISVQITDILPVVVFLSIQYFFLLMIFTQIKTDKILDSRKYNIYKVWWMTLFTQYAFWEIGVKNKIGIWFTLLIAVLVAVLIELVYWAKYKRKKQKSVDTSKITRMDIEDDMQYFITSRFLIRYAICAIIGSLLIGFLCAYCKNEYQIIEMNNKEYAIVVDKGDNAIVESITVKNKRITIDTSYHYLISKNNRKIKVKSFESVNVQGKTMRKESRKNKK